MIRKIIFVVSFFVIISGCGKRIAGEMERPVFQGPEPGKWWIINSITTDARGKYYHQSCLLGTDQIQDRKYISFISSQWNASDSTFLSGTINSEMPTIKTIPVFPVKMGLSSDNDWYWQLGRKNMQLSVKLSNTALDTTVLQTTTYKFARQDPFQLVPMLNVTGVNSMQPLMVKEHTRGMTTPRTKGTLFMSVISRKEIFFKAAKNSSVVWIDLLMSSGKKMNLLFNVNKTGAIAPNGLSAWDQKGQKISGNKLEIQNLATDPGNEKKYPLRYQIIDDEGDYSCVILPVTDQQVVYAQKQSCWMGAVDAVDSKTGKKKGAGNMYIFKQ